MFLVMALTRYGEGFTGSSASAPAWDEKHKAKIEVEISDACMINPQKNNVRNRAV